MIDETYYLIEFDDVHKASEVRDAIEDDGGECGFYIEGKHPQQRFIVAMTKRDVLHYAPWAIESIIIKLL